MRIRRGAEKPPPEPGTTWGEAWIIFEKSLSLEARLTYMILESYADEGLPADQVLGSLAKHLGASKQFAWNCMRELSEKIDYRYQLGEVRP